MQHTVFIIHSKEAGELYTNYEASFNQSLQVDLSAMAKGVDAAFRS